MMKKGSLITAVACVALRVVAQSAATDLGDVFSDAAKWALAPDAFQGEYQGLGFHFVDGKQTAMSNQKTLLKFVGLEVCEARIYFDPGAVRRVELSLYNKGDSGGLDQGAFKELVGKVNEAICAFAGSKGVSGKTTSERANYFVSRHQWVRKPMGIQLEWAYVDPHRSERQLMPFRAEFVKVVLALAKEGSLAPAAGGAPTWVNAANARTVKVNVKSSPAGDVWVDNVPMVDQGQKGYCAAASAERILRYYGRQVDQHEIAQLADTAAEGGTTLEGMSKAIAKVGRQFQLDKKDLISSDSDGNFEKSDHVKLIDQYNAVAKKRKATQIDWHEFTQNHMVDLPAIWQAMDPDILLAARNGQKQAMGQFVKTVKLYVDQGVPLIWSCLVGMYPEEPPLGQNGAFGHVRLIIGYNEKTQEILYSDSWGPRHALKRLPLDKVWAMTKGLTVLKPRDVR